MEAMTNALAIPHILSAILKELEVMHEQDRRQHRSCYPAQDPHLNQNHSGFVKCSRVSKLWADLVTDLLWRDSPPIAIFQDISSSRRQYYARKVKRMHLQAPLGVSPDYFSFLSDVQFPRLKRLKVSVNLAHHHLYLTPLLRSGIEHVDLSALRVSHFDQFKTEYLDVLVVSTRLPLV
jgi:hypothetical protein